MKIINKRAPVHLVKEILINATPQQVWTIMTDVDNWSSWQKNITKALLEDRLEVGSSFNMINAGDEIRATFHTIQPYQFFGWESHYEGLDVTHNWTLTQQEGRTLVTDEEGMEGAFAEANNANIQASIKKSKPEWLHYLKATVENTLTSK